MVIGSILRLAESEDAWCWLWLVNTVHGGHPYFRETIAGAAGDGDDGVALRAATIGVGRGWMKRAAPAGAAPGHAVAAPVEAILALPESWFFPVGQAFVRDTETFRVVAET